MEPAPGQAAITRAQGRHSAAAAYAVCRGCIFEITRPGFLDAGDGAANCTLSASTGRSSVRPPGAAVALPGLGLLASPRLHAVIAEALDTEVRRADCQTPRFCSLWVLGDSVPPRPAAVATVSHLITLDHASGSLHGRPDIAQHQLPARLPVPSRPAA